MVIGMTKQRAIIYEIIMSSPRHMTADEIFDAARQRMPGIARATVYRNLGLMEKDGQVRRLRLANEPDRFDRTLEHHEHVRCPRCGRIDDIALPWLQECVEEALGRSIQSVTLSVNALCGDCAQEPEHELPR